MGSCMSKDENTERQGRGPGSKYEFSTPSGAHEMQTHAKYARIFLLLFVVVAAADFRFNAFGGGWGRGD